MDLPAKAVGNRAHLHLRGRSHPLLETLAATGISPDKRARDLTDEELVQLRDHIEGNYKVEGDLRREVAADIRRKVEIGCYAGIRHRRACPCVASGPRPMHGPARARSGPSPARRSPARSSS
ncbi:30S ribosomal protein S13 [Micromonospora sp. M12]